MNRTVLPVAIALVLAGASGAAAATNGFQRLGADVTPALEEIHLRAAPDSTRYSGWVRVTLEVHRPTREVQLHADGQRLERIALSQGGRAIPVKSQRGDRGLLTLTADRPLASGPALLEIAFSNEYNHQAVGLYSVVKDSLAYLITQFEAEDARRAFPCWDQPCFKLPYQLTVEVPEKQQVFSNTTIARTAKRSGWKTVEFEKTPPLPSYLLALGVGPFDFVDVPGMGFPTRIVTARGQARLARVAAAAVPPLVAALGKWFGIPYPYRKLDLIAAPDFWLGGMENAGAIVFGENYLLADSALATPTQRGTISRVVCHELAHMWFGDLVTMAWWDDLWLNESFADWMADKITDQVAPELKVPLTEMQAIQGVMTTDSRPSTDPIRQTNPTADEAQRGLGIGYYKGKAVLAMFERWIGPDTFQRGLQQYLKAHAWKNATNNDLWTALNTASGKDVTVAMKGFVEQNGIPLVSLVPLADGSLRLTQSRLHNVGVNVDARSWQIPITLRWSDGKAVHVQALLLDQPSVTVRLEGAGRPAWIMPNVEGRGYYRWNVTPEMLLKLAGESANIMTPVERIAFLGNLVALLYAGEIKGDTYLQVLAGFAGDPEPLAAAAVLTRLQRAKASFVPDSMAEVYGTYLRKSLKPMSERYGIERRSGEEGSVSVLRPQMLSVLGDDGHDPATLAAAGRIADQFLVDPRSADQAVAGTALQLRAIRGDRVLFDRYCRGFETAATPADRQCYLNALGYFDDSALQDAALQYVLEGSVRPSEVYAVPLSVYGRSDRGKDRVLRWVMDNYAKLKTRMPDEYLVGMATFGGNCQEERWARAKEFFTQPEHQVPGIQKVIRQNDEAIQDCVNLRAREGAAVAAYLSALAANGHAADKAP